MSNNSKPHPELIGTKVRHDFSKYVGEITKVREDIRGYNYYVEWEIVPERNDWYQLNVLERLAKSSLRKGDSK